jgi:hypothetical protein
MKKYIILILFILLIPVKSFAKPTFVKPVKKSMIYISGVNKILGKQIKTRLKLFYNFAKPTTKSKLVNGIVIGKIINKKYNKKDVIIVLFKNKLLASRLIGSLLFFKYNIIMINKKLNVLYGTHKTIKGFKAYYLLYVY